MVEGAYAPIIMQFGGEIGQVVFTYSVIYPKISLSSKLKKLKIGKLMNYHGGTSRITRCLLRTKISCKSII